MSFDYEQTARDYWQRLQDVDATDGLNDPDAAYDAWIRAMNGGGVMVGSVADTTRHARADVQGGDVAS